MIDKLDKRTKGGGHNFLIAGCFKARTGSEGSIIKLKINANLYWNIEWDEERIILKMKIWSPIRRENVNCAKKKKKKKKRL